MIMRWKRHRIGEKKKWDEEDKCMNSGPEGGQRKQRLCLQLHHVGLISAAAALKCLCGALKGTIICNVLVKLQCSAG